MSEKFEKLLDLLVNEEKNKAEDLFHEIVVDKSRETMQMNQLKIQKQLKKLKTKKKSMKPLKK